VEYFLSLPLGYAIAALFVIVMLRANGTYWLGRGIAAGARRTRLERYLDSPAAGRAERLIARWGPAAVTLSFFTFGIQTAVNAIAGAARMPLRKYLPAVVVGCLCWAVIYATVGLAAIAVVVQAAMSHPAVPAVLLAAAGGVAVYAVFKRRRAESRREAPRTDEPHPDEPHTDDVSTK
jgi:membrane protein DedA with SNARE-associated domain